MNVGEDAAAFRGCNVCHLTVVSCSARAHTLASWVGVQGTVTCSCNLFFFSFVYSLTASLLAGLPFISLNEQQSPYHRGFFCNDESIKYPYKEETISAALLGGVLFPFTIITVSASVLFSANGFLYVLLTSFALFFF